MKYELTFASISGIGHVIFEEHGKPGENDENKLLTGLYFSAKDWVKMGKPQSVVITLEPNEE